MRIQVLHHEIPEAELLRDVLRQLDEQGTRIFLYEARTYLPGRLSHAALRRLEDDGHLGDVIADVPAQLYARVDSLHLRPVPLVHHETDVGDYPEQVLAVLGVQIHGLVIVGRQQNLGTRPLPELELLLVQGLFQKLRTLLEHQFVERGQIGGIIPYRVLHQQYGLHS